MEIATTLDRPRSSVMEQAVRDYVLLLQWQLAAIDEGIRAADGGMVVAHDDVVKWVRSWDGADELLSPMDE